MDGGVNAAFTPFEALLDDMYHEQAGGSQRAFGMKSFMVSFGGSFGEFFIFILDSQDFFYFSAYLLCSLDLNSFALSEILGGADRLLFLILFFGFSLAIYISLGEVHRSNHSVNIFHFAQIQPNPTRESKKKMRFYFSQMREFKIGATYLLFIYHSISSNCHHFYSRFQQ